MFGFVICAEVDVHKKLLVWRDRPNLLSNKNTHKIILFFGFCVWLIRFNVFHMAIEREKNIKFDFLLSIDSFIFNKKNDRKNLGTLPLAWTIQTCSKQHSFCCCLILPQLHILTICFSFFLLFSEAKPIHWEPFQLM